MRKTLLSSLDYSDEYFENISNVLSTTFKVKHSKKDPECKVKNWWGKLENITLELSLNSKIWQSNFFKKKAVLLLFVWRGGRAWIF